MAYVLQRCPLRQRIWPGLGFLREMLYDDGENQRQAAVFVRETGIVVRMNSEENDEDKFRYRKL